MTTTTTITATQTEFIPFGDVVAELNFYSAPADGSSPYNYIGIPPPGMEQSNVGIDPKSITIYDLRGNESKLSLDKEAFSFHTIPSSLTYGDFDNEEKIRSIYYPEIKDIVRKHVSGAKEVIIFDHTIRRSGPNAESTVQRVHIDQTTKSGELRLRRYLTPERVQEVLKKNIRFQIVNIWRPINGAVVSYPLAFADSSTVADDDIVGVAHIYPDYEGQTAGVKYNPNQKWWYASGIKNDEVTLIKCFDSWTGESGERRRAPHSAFVHPNTPAGAKGRESIEVRCLIVGE
ncbi:hypothetical protein FN846DRAFT_328319 [Sphaerosporella brunnea]|uniref:Methyltransferase n=1 Tax=Sphaerosporella brunnea TaxID=1250544 RepID=A0A5J5EKJ4_9PEZI|nr:hypothetical protein FN846DRAFT_328319 [Sphaerosporella brunnea]